MARLPKNDKVVDIGTIAAALGVSKTTVSRAISGNGRVGAATRQRVQDYVKEHNYTPSVMARGLAMRCSYNISLVVSKQFSDFEMPFLRKTMRSVYQVAEDCDYDVLLTLVGENETRPEDRRRDSDPHAGTRPADPAAEKPQAALCSHRPPRGSDRDVGGS